MRYGREMVDGYRYIPFEAIIAYINEKNIPDDQRLFYYYVIRTIDEKYGELKYKQMKEERNRLKGKK